MESKRIVPAGLLAALAILAMGGCGGGSSSPGLAELEAQGVAQRIRAIKWAGQERVETAVPLLVDRLAEDDAAVRFYAIQALERITGETLGYRYLASASERAEAVARWRAALAAGRWTGGSGSEGA